MTNEKERKGLVEFLLDLAPLGTGKVLHLKWINPYFNEHFIKECIEELPKLELRMAMGEEMNSLEKLAVYAMLDLAIYWGYETTEDEKRI